MILINPQFLKLEMGSQVDSDISESNKKREINVGILALFQKVVLAFEFDKIEAIA